GENTYTGGTNAYSGYLVVGDGGTHGSVLGNIRFDNLMAFDRSDSITFAGNLSGTRRFYNYGRGTLTLTGNLSHSGRTHIPTGTLQIGNGSQSGALSSNFDNYGVLGFYGNYQVYGNIAGTGSLYNKGNLALLGLNTYTGTTTAMAGTLTLYNPLYGDGP